MTSAIAVQPEIISTKTPKRYTLEEYLVREARSRHKHEFYNGEIKIMPGGTDKHSLIGMNTGYAIKTELKKKQNKFLVYNSEMGIYLPELDFVLYADVLAVYEKPEFWQGNRHLLLNPILIVEVASKSTRKFDRVEKFEAYQTIPSLKEYILIEQNKPQVESRLIHTETHYDVKIESDINKTIALRSLGVDISLADIYENIEF